MHIFEAGGGPNVLSRKPGWSQEPEKSLHDQPIFLFHQSGWSRELKNGLRDQNRSDVDWNFKVGHMNWKWGSVTVTLTRNWAI